MINVLSSDLRPGDRIMHPGAKVKDKDRVWRHVATVAKKPSIRPGSTHLSCECVNAAGEKVRIALGEQETVDIERRGK